MNAFDPGSRTARLLAGLVLLSFPIPCLAGPIYMVDVTAQTRITFRHNNGFSGRYHIAETVCAGLASFDYDNDGDIDLYFLNSAIPLKAANDASLCNALYRNDGNWRFTDVTEGAGVGDAGFGLGVAVADYDNDGDQDIYLNNHGPNVLYRNNGDGTFTDVTSTAGVGNGDAVGAGANFLDVEGDGDVDLYVSNYVECPDVESFQTTRAGHPAYLGPAAAIYENTRDALYRNNGDGTFTDITDASGIGAHEGAGMGTVCGDIDNDRDTDIIVANDMTGNFLFLNDGHGRFEEMGLMAAMAYSQHGEEQGSMGPELGDYDNDGLLDLYITAYQDQLGPFYRNLGDGFFEDITTQTGAGAGTVSSVTWGSALLDFDQDGYRDLFVACGHLQPNVESYDDRTTYNQFNKLYHNDGKGKFMDVSNQSGPGLQVKLSSRGAAFDDFDDDGDVDIAILNSGGAPTLLRNDSPNQGHWLQVRLRGTKTNRDGVGTHVKVVAGDLTLVSEVHSGRGYQSHYGTRLYFGLGDREQIDRIEVRWIGGGIDIFRAIKADQLVTLVEGEGKTSSQ
ncbi:MAG: CRTAC1 family protein [Phycisphaerales bacterium]|nr:MAG: CRTAC1 family protein [Phycisphaerales bacterium]